MEGYERSKNWRKKEKIVGGIFSILATLATIIWTYVLCYMCITLLPNVYFIPYILAFIVGVFGLVFSCSLLYTGFRIFTGYYQYEDVYKEYLEQEK